MRSGGGEVPRSGKSRQSPAPEYKEGDPVWELTKEIAVAMREGRTDLADVQIESAHPEGPDLFVIKAVVGLPIPDVKPGSIAAEMSDPIVAPVIVHVKFGGEVPTKDNLFSIKIIIPDPTNPGAIQFTPELIRQRGEELDDIAVRARQIFLEYIRKPRGTQRN